MTRGVDEAFQRRATGRARARQVPGAGCRAAGPLGVETPPTPTPFEGGDSLRGWVYQAFSGLLGGLGS